MFTTKKMSAFLGLVFLVGCASTSDQATKEVYNDGSWFEYSAAGKPVRFSDSSGRVFALNSSLLVEQVFDDGSRLEYSAAGKPVRTTDTSGRVFDKKPMHALSSL